MGILQSYKRILLFGAGAIGGYFGGQLALAGNDISFVARGSRLLAMQKNGLTLKSTAGEVTPVAVKAIKAAEGRYDLIIVAVKSGDTDNAAKVCATHLADGGVVLSLQNGVDNADKLAKVFGADHVVGGVIMSGISVPEAGVIMYVPGPSITIGGLTDSSKQYEPSIIELLVGAGIKCHVSDDIRRIMWQKLARNIVINPTSALTGATLGDMWDNPHMFGVMKTLLAETVATAHSFGINFDKDDEKKVLTLVDVFKNYKTSMLQDVEQNKPIELDGIMGIVAAAHESGQVNAPVVHALYNIMKFIFEDRWHHTFPRLAADVIAYNGDNVLLIERKNEPYGWAIPGGMAELGETIEHTAARELEEETGIAVKESDLQLLGIYSDPSRDTRGHTISAVYYAVADQMPLAADDAKSAKYFKMNELPKLVFDHDKVLADFLKVKK